MTKLLVSVRNADEALDALAGGADLIDIKEPNNGSLGAADAKIWEEISRRIGSRKPLSIALGELTDIYDKPLPSNPDGIAYAKIGLAGCASIREWRELWKRSFDQLRGDVQRVAVVYADWLAASAPEPLDIIGNAEFSNCSVLLVDTFAKSNGTLISTLGKEKLLEITASARARGLTIVLGGSITTSILPLVLEAEPDYVAVRGAVCRGPREGCLDRELVREFSVAMNDLAGATQAPSSILG